jgi:hypothetical protein
MKLSEIRDCYYESSCKVSDIVRQLGLAGIAIIWIFKVGTESGGIKYSKELLLPLGVLIGSLALDLLQYVYKTALNGIANYYYYRKYHVSDVDVPYPEWWNWPSLVLFWCKIVSIFIGYILLLKFIYSQLDHLT